MCSMQPICCTLRVSNQSTQRQLSHKTNTKGQQTYLAPVWSKTWTHFLPGTWASSDSLPCPHKRLIKPACFCLRGLPCPSRGVLLAACTATPHSASCPALCITAHAVADATSTGYLLNTQHVVNHQLASLLHEHVTQNIFQGPNLRKIRKLQ